MIKSEIIRISLFVGLLGAGCSKESGEQPIEKTTIRMPETEQPVSASLVAPKEDVMSTKSAPSKFPSEGGPRLVVASTEDAVQRAGEIVQRYFPDRVLPEPMSISETSNEYIIIYPFPADLEAEGEHKCTKVTVYKKSDRIGVVLDAEIPD